MAGVTLLVVSIWLQRLGRPVVYTLVPMLLVATVTLWSMLEQLIGYFADARWLLAVMGSLVLVLDIWVLLEGLRMLASERSEPRDAQSGARG